ncbi:ComEA family DNA-binding protein [Cupriavidus alkaliphilus]|uniref:ComEA family DNA-binding protein n=1 Tax=Cupriavidus alkaliphilus TaxID=942866 RepID=UPI000DC512D8|nr:helix-hairpin-helix domain-containing protein [Cupriavidus alkaliphilus]MBB2919025.1 competence protein ComEA [Cupriavidus alkaliphilus]RAS12087.1 competence protein ComEA [Cupriavidus alkaliphilus]
MAMHWIRQLARRFSLISLAATLCLLAGGTARAAVDVNTADEAALTAVKGVGPATARHIVEERNKRGPYKDAADLAERVSGIGPKSVARLQDAGLTIAGKGAPTAAPSAAPQATPAPAKGAKATPAPAKPAR